MRNALDLFRKSGTGTWDPASEISQLHRGIDRLFEGFVTPFESETNKGWMTDRAGLSPAVDVSEEEDHYLMTFDLPGVNKEAVKIELNDNVLTVSGERKDERTEGDGKSSKRVVERFYGTFTRSFSLPANVDSNRIEADYKDGVLRVAVPKAQVAKPKKIEIGTTNKEGSGFLSLLVGGKTETGETGKESKSGKQVA